MLQLLHIFPSLQSIIWLEPFLLCLSLEHLSIEKPIIGIQLQDVIWSASDVFHVL